MKPVKQRTAFDCAVCCLAMATGEDYEAVISNLERPALIDLAQQRGFQVIHDMDLLDKLGFEYESFYTPKGYEPKSSNPAILMVNSKNRKGKKHSIFFDGKEIIDPSDKKTYGTKDGLTACEFVIEITSIRGIKQ